MLPPPSTVCTGSMHLSSEAWIYSPIWSCAPLQSIYSLVPPGWSLQPIWRGACCPSGFLGDLGQTTCPRSAPGSPLTSEEGVRAPTCSGPGEGSASRAFAVNRGCRHPVTHVLWKGTDTPRIKIDLASRPLHSSSDPERDSWGGRWGGGHGAGLR